MKLKGIKICSMVLLFSLSPIKVVSAHELPKHYEESIQSLENVHTLQESNYVETFPLQVEEGVILNFFSKEDRDSYLNGKAARGTHFETILSSQNLNNRHIATNPLTPHWSFADQYTISVAQNVSVNGSVSHNGFSLAVNTTLQRGVTISLPANPSRASRLAIRADVTVERVRRTTIDGWSGIPNVTEFYRVSNTRNITNFVEYR